jgi:hypothetical protein
MKPVIFILASFGLVGVLGAVTDLHTIVIGYTIWGRLASLSFGIIALVGAWGCYKRTPYGWYVVEALIWICAVSAVARAIFVALKLELPFLGAVLGGLGEGVKIVIFACVMLPFWSKQRKKFSLPNHPTEPTSASVTAPAGQEPRQT